MNPPLDQSASENDEFKLNPGARDKVANKI